MCQSFCVSGSLAAARVVSAMTSLSDLLSSPRPLDPTTRCDRTVDPRPTTSLLITGLARGGAETQLVALARHLDAHGWPVDVVSLLPTAVTDERLLAVLARHGISVWSPGLAGPGSI